MILTSAAAACIAAAAAAYQIPPATFAAIQHVEGGAAGVVHTNANGTEDLGLMQVNTSWLPSLTRYFGLAGFEATYRLVRDDDCANATAAAAILLLYWREAGRLDLAVAYYHSHTPALGMPYLERVGRAQLSIESRP